MAVKTATDAVFAVAQCLSICPSVTLVHCIQTAEDIIKLHSRPGSPIILVFWPPAPVHNSKGTPSVERKIQGVEISFSIFD